MIFIPIAPKIERFHSRGQHLCKFIGTKERVCIRKEFNSQRTGLRHQHGRRFIVLGHQYGRRDVIWKHSISKLVGTVGSQSNGKKNNGKFYSGIVFTICTNHWILPKNSRYSLKLFFFSVWKVPSGNTGLLSQMFSLLRNIFFRNDTKSSAPYIFQTDLSGNFLF